MKKPKIEPHLTLMEWLEARRAKLQQRLNDVESAIDDLKKDPNRLSALDKIRKDVIETGNRL